MGTLTSSDHNFAYTSTLTNFRYRYCTLATSDYLEPFRYKDYIRIITFSPDLLRIFFRGEIISIRCSTTTKSSSFIAQIQISCQSLKSCYDNRKLSLSLWLLSRANSYKVATPVGTSDPSSCHFWLAQIYHISPL